MTTNDKLRAVSFVVIVISTATGLYSVLGVFRSKTSLQTQIQNESIDRTSMALAAAQRELNDSQIAFERQIVAEIRALQKNQGATGGGDVSCRSRRSCSIG